MNRDDDAALWRSIVAAALTAPWADNRPALRFEWRAAADVLEWHSTEGTVWQRLPHRRWLALLAFGAALESARLRAAAHGRVLQLRVGDDTAGPVAFTRLAARCEITAQDAALEAALAARCTNRRFYRRERLPQPTLEAIASAAGASLHWLDARPLRRGALRLLRSAEAERFAQWRLHNELFDSIRLDLGWKKSAAHGLPPAALEVEAPMRVPFALLRHAAIARSAARLGAPWILAWRAAGLPCLLAPHLAVLVTPRGNPDDTVRSTLEAGRALLRAWLAATHAGLAVQPFAACGALLRQVPGDGWVRPRTLAQLRSARSSLLARLGLDPACDLQIFLRIGKAGPPTVRTERETLTRVLPPALRDPPE